jgi:hypothetical protein
VFGLLGALKQSVVVVLYLCSSYCSETSYFLVSSDCSGEFFWWSLALLGDFNSILSSSEKSGGRCFGSSSHNDFADFVHSNALVDLGFVGNRFTWSNHRLGHANIRERLDRGLANHGWMQLFPNAIINHFPAIKSDHCPILLSTMGTYQNLPKPFRFEAFWTRDKSSFLIVAEAWLARVGAGSPAFSLSRKWRNTKLALKDWNTITLGIFSLELNLLCLKSVRFKLVLILRIMLLRSLFCKKIYKSSFARGSVVEAEISGALAYLHGPKHQIFPRLSYLSSKV